MKCVYVQIHGIGMVVPLCEKENSWQGLEINSVRKWNSGLHAGLISPINCPLRDLKLSRKSSSLHLRHPRVLSKDMLSVRIRHNSYEIFHFYLRGETRLLDFKPTTPLAY